MVDGNVTYDDFFEKTSGLGKLYLDGLICVYNGKEVPCICHQTPKYSIDGKKFPNIFKTFEILHVYDKEHHMD